MCLESRSFYQCRAHVRLAPESPSDLALEHYSEVVSANVLIIPNVVRLVLFKRGDRKFAGTKWCFSLHCKLEVP